MLLIILLIILDVCLLIYVVKDKKFVIGIMI